MIWGYPYFWKHPVGNQTFQQKHVPMMSTWSWFAWRNCSFFASNISGKDLCGICVGDLFVFFFEIYNANWHCKTCTPSPKEYKQYKQHRFPEKRAQKFCLWFRNVSTWKWIKIIELADTFLVWNAGNLCNTWDSKHPIGTWSKIKLKLVENLWVFCRCSAFSYLFRWECSILFLLDALNTWCHP